MMGDDAVRAAEELVQKAAAQTEAIASAQRVAEIVAGYYRGLTANGVPDNVAGWLTSQWQASTFLLVTQP